jgi:MFS family permease
MAMNRSIALLIGTFIMLFGAGGMRGSFGVFVYPWEQSLDSNRGQIGLIAALGLLVFGLIQPIVGGAIDRVGPGRIAPLAVIVAALGCFLSSMVDTAWLLAITYSLIACLGFGALSNAPLSSIVARHFTIRRGLALGVCGTGTPLGMMILSPGLAYAIEQFGWRITMVLMAVFLAAILSPIAWLFSRGEPGHASTASGPAAHGVRNALASRPYLLLAGSYFICGITTVGLVQTHLVPHALDLGVPQVEAAKILGLIGFVNAIGLLFFGWAADRWGSRAPLVAVYLTRALALSWLAIAVDERMLIPFAIAFGMTDMATIPLVASGTANLFGRQSVGALYGLAALGHQIGSALGAWLGGQGYLVWGSYQPVILIGAGLAAIAAIMAASLERRAPIPSPQPA